jgi:hypothetical protein
MMISTRRSTTRAVMLTIVLQAAALAQTHQQPVTANLCEVVASPVRYNKRVLTVEGILSPSEHSLALYNPSCKPKEGFDVTIEALLPTAWVSLPNGKKLQKFLKSGKEASVRVTGTFETGDGRYGPDVARFRFVISEIASVEKAPPGVKR